MMTDKELLDHQELVLCNFTLYINYDLYYLETVSHCYLILTKLMHQLS